MNTKHLQKKVLAAFTEPMTVEEVAQKTKLQHGQVQGAVYHLHKKGDLAKVSQKGNKGVYSAAPKQEMSDEELLQAARAIFVEIERRLASKALRDAKIKKILEG